MFSLNIIASADVLDLFMDKFGINWQLLGVQIVNFVLVSFILYKFAFKPVLQSMDERKKKINEGIELSKRIKSDLIKSNENCAKLIKEATKKSGDMIRDAKEEAEKLNAKQLLEGKKIAEMIVEKANNDIEMLKENMMTDAKSEIKSLIVKLSEKVLGKHMSDTEKSKYNKDIIDLIAKN